MASLKLIQLLSHPQYSTAPNGRPWLLHDVDLGGKGSIAVDASLLTVFSPLDVARLHIFSSRATSDFVPNAPPALAPMTLPGTDRRPFKPWFMCTEQEKVCGVLFMMMMIRLE